MPGDHALRVGERVFVEYLGSEPDTVFLSGTEADVLIVMRKPAYRKRAKLAAGVRLLMDELGRTPEDLVGRAERAKRTRKILEGR